MSCKIEAWKDGSYAEICNGRLRFEDSGDGSRKLKTIELSIKDALSFVGFVMTAEHPDDKDESYLHLGQVEIMVSERIITVTLEEEWHGYEFDRYGLVGWLVVNACKLNYSEGDEDD